MEKSCAIVVLLCILIYNFFQILPLLPIQGTKIAALLCSPPFNFLRIPFFQSTSLLFVENGIRSRMPYGCAHGYLSIRCPTHQRQWTLGRRELKLLLSLTPLSCISNKLGHLESQEEVRYE